LNNNNNNKMPKVGSKTKLKRTARRIATSNPLASAETLRGRDILAAEQPESSQSSGHDETGIASSSLSSFQQQQQQLSRGQRKRLAKRENFFKKEKLILSSLLLKQQEEQAKRIDGLDAIKNALLSSVTTTGEKNGGIGHTTTQLETGPLVTTNKAKRKLVAEEVEHMSLILQHPAYKKDPFETMQEHLQNTFAGERKQQELLSKKRADQERRQLEEKQKLKKEDRTKKKKSQKKYKPRRTN
jgi:hypothetical protein